MKRLLLILVFVASSFTALAQEPDFGRDDEVVEEKERAPYELKKVIHALESEKILDIGYALQAMIDSPRLAGPLTADEIKG